MIQENNRPIIFFDGYCNLCNFWVDSIIKRDRNKLFRFDALQSEIAQRILRELDLTVDTPESVLLVDGGAIYSKSTAILRISRKLPYPTRMISWLVVIPKALRDLLYDIIARNRYRWFGRRDVCRK